MYVALSASAFAVFVAGRLLPGVVLDKVLPRREVRRQFAREPCQRPRGVSRVRRRDSSHDHHALLPSVVVDDGLRAHS